jgi:phosphoesterase RecJ-like protein
LKVPLEVLDALKNGTSFVVATHSPLDGDALGSGLAVTLALRNDGRDCLFVNEDPVPAAYRFLAGTVDVVVLGEGAPPKADVLIGLDAGPDRLGRAYTDRAESTQFINIDHHVSNDGNSQLAWIEPEAAATGEMVYHLLRALDLKIDAAIAESLYVALVTDTGRFSYANTVAHTLEVAADLVRCGANPEAIHKRLYHVPLRVLTLQSRAVERLRVHADGRLATLTVMPDFGADLGVEPENVKDLIDLLKSIESVFVCALVRGLPRGGTKVSLRSNTDGADVAAFAARWGGGGHTRAAGCSFDEGPDAVLKRILSDLEKLTVAAGE